MKIVKYSVEELIINPKDVSKNLNKICSGREIKWEVTGICQKGEIVILALNQCEKSTDNYLFAKIQANSVDDIEIEIRTHWESDTYLMGIIELNADEFVALYRKVR